MEKNRRNSNTDIIVNFLDTEYFGIQIIRIRKVEAWAEIKGGYRRTKKDVYQVSTTKYKIQSFL